MWKNIVESGRPLITIWRICTACWIANTTNIHSQYVILISFSLQKSLLESASMLHYISTVRLITGLFEFLRLSVTMYNVFTYDVLSFCPLFSGK